MANVPPRLLRRESLAGPPQEAYGPRASGWGASRAPASVGCLSASRLHSSGPGQAPQGPTGRAQLSQPQPTGEAWAHALGLGMAQTARPGSGKQSRTQTAARAASPHRPGAPPEGEGPSPADPRHTCLHTFPTGPGQTLSLPGLKYPVLTQPTPDSSWSPEDLPGGYCAPDSRWQCLTPWNTWALGYSPYVPYPSPSLKLLPSGPLSMASSCRKSLALASKASLN